MEYKAIDVASAAILLRSVGNPSRLSILLHLLQGEKSVAELESELGLRQPNLSQQLAELRNVGLVATRREAKSVFYRHADEAAQRFAAGLVQSFAGAPKPASRANPSTMRDASRQAAVFAKVMA